MRQPPNPKGGIYHVKDNFELDEMEGKGQQEVNVIQKLI